MKLQDFIRPASLESARSALRDLGEAGLAIAGGTALHFMQDPKPKTAVDITALGLSGIHEENGHYTIGATTPLADIMHYRADNWAFHEINRRIATHQIRNISTIGGNIARVFPWADLPVALLALDATMKIYGEKEFEMKADEFFSSQPARLFKDGDILTAVRIPVLGRGMGYGSHKEVRTKSGFSIMSACAVMTLKDGAISAVRIGAGGATNLPCRVPKVEEGLLGRNPERSAFEDAVKNGIDDIGWKGREGMSDEYARHLAEVVLVDVLERAAGYAERRSQ
jgi:CO/xanthine dehydrogenase FAD-binding subunit